MGLDKFLRSIRLQREKGLWFFPGAKLRSAGRPMLLQTQGSRGSRVVGPLWTACHMAMVAGSESILVVCLGFIALGSTFTQPNQGVATIASVAQPLHSFCLEIQNRASGKIKVAEGGSTLT